MKHNKLLLTLFTIILFSCGDNTSSEASQEASVKTNLENKPTESEAENVVYPEFNWDTLQGLYSGMFGGSEIRIKINYISDKNVVGYNVHKGLVRNIHGPVEQTMESVILNLEEPGDHPYDGKFVLTVDRKTLAIKANWTPNDTINLRPKTVTLDRVNTDYKDISEGIDAENFSVYFSYVGDTIGEMYFKEDGLVIYRYYPNTDYDERREQYKEIKGSWTFQKNGAAIDWQKNEIFPGTSHVQIIREDEYYAYLKMGTRTLYPSPF